MIIFEKVNKYYFNNTTTVKQEVLKDISLVIKKGDSISVVGPSGSGKSTFLNLIGTIDRPTSGSIKFYGIDISQLNDNQLSGLRNKRMGFIFQTHHLLPQLNLYENVLLPTLAGYTRTNKHLNSERAIELINQVGLKDKIYQYPSQLSGGECQRATVVRALINQPDIILADEPTGSLDQKSAEQVGDLLSDIQQQHNLTLIVVTHSKVLADKMKTKYILVDGQLEQIK